MTAARTYVPRLLARAFKQRDAICFEAAWWLASPPFATAAALLMTSTLLAAIAGGWTVVLLAASAFGLLVLSLFTGLVQARAGIRTWLALVAAPWYIVWKVIVQMRAVASALRRDDYYEPTARA